MTQVLWYASLRSPYSWLALEQARRHNLSLYDTATMRVFYEPSDVSLARMSAAGTSFHYTAMSKAKHLYILRDVRRLAAALGTTITWPIDTDVDWEPSAALCQAVLNDNQIVGKELVLAISRARWTEALDISNLKELKRIAGEVGAEKIETLADIEQSDLLQQMAMDMDYDGVFGVPYFKIGREPFWGVDRLFDAEAYLKSLKGQQACKHPSYTEAQSTNFDTSAEGHAGGCG